MAYLAVLFDEYGHILISISENNKKKVFEKLVFYLYDISSLEKIKEEISSEYEEEFIDDEEFIEFLLSEEVLEDQLNLKLAGIFKMPDLDNVATEIAGDINVVIL